MTTRQLYLRGGAAVTGALMCTLIVLTTPANILAQSASMSKSGEQIAGTETPVEISRYAERFDDWRARYGSTPELEAMIKRLSTKAARSSNSNSGSPELSKGAGLSDLMLIPDQALKESRGYGTPTLLAISDELLALAYTDQGIDGPDFFGEPAKSPRLLFRTSTDGGNTWGIPVVVADTGDFILDYNLLSMGINDGGRLVLIDETPFEDNHAFYSDDFGATWTGIPYEETNAADRIFGPISGSFWVQEIEFPQTSVDYITSVDGVTWGDMQTMLPVAAGHERYLTDIANLGNDTYLAAFDQFTFQPCCSDAVVTSRSTDGGATWSTVSLLSPPKDVVIRDVQLDAGTGDVVHLAAVGFPQDGFGGDIYTSTSTDGGLNFTPLEPWTTFVGDDFGPSQAFVNGVPFIAFSSIRGTMNFASRVWSGGLGSNADLDPAPLVDFLNFPGGWAPAGREFPLTPVRVLDESSAASAELHVRRGGDEVIVPLFDDGAHDDEEAGDGIFGGTSTSVEFGPDLEVTPVGTDDGGNTGYGWTATVTVAALHDVGELLTVVTPDGAFGSEMVNDFGGALHGRYPKEDGAAHVAYGGLWVGINKSPGKRVSHTFYDNFFGAEGGSTRNGDWQVTEFPSEAPGESELDITMHYDDSGSPNPMGLDVKQTTYQWSWANFIILDYEITNSSGDDLTELFAALAVDPDMQSGADPTDDQVGYDADRALLYAKDSGNWCAENEPALCTDVHLGVALLSDSAGAVGKTVPTPHTATFWDWNNDPARNTIGLDVGMYDLMTSGIWAGFNLGLLSAVDERRMVLTAQPFDLAAGETKRIVFGLVAAPGEGGIQASTDMMAETFEKSVLAVTQTDPIPRTFALDQNYPNPFNPSTTIPFSVASPSLVRLAVFDVLGRKVGEIVNETLSAGSYTATFETEALPSGTYYYTLTAGGQSITKSMFLLK